MAMSPYEETLVAEQLKRMDGPVNQFLADFATRRSRLGDGQRTLIFFPGGMASDLVRADRPFDQPNPVYETLWVDAFEIFVEGAALGLQMNGPFDSGQHLIVPDGPLTNCLETPYAEFLGWCGDNDLDVLPVGWDFRRSIAWNVAFFLDHLVPMVRSRTADDPFARTTIVGHSFGGMLAKGILNDPANPFCQDLQCAITVGAPFYGYPGQTERLFRSEPLLGPLYEQPHMLPQITLAIATMPGGFALFFLDGQTYDDNAQALAADAEFPLNAYPSVDAADPTLRVDPYAFQLSRPGNPNQSRYPLRGRQPPWPWFEDYLAAGLREYQQVAQPLDPAVRDKLHCIRGVQTRPQAEGGAVIDGTRDRQEWGWFDATREMWLQTGVVNSQFWGPGDGVQPAWSARLVTQPPANIHTIRGQVDANGNGLNHAALMDFPAVRSTILQLMRPGVEAQTAELPVAPATLTDFLEVRNDIRRISARWTRWGRRRAFEAYVRELGPQRSRALMKRWFIELPRGSEAGRTSGEGSGPASAPARGRSAR
jgi:hypothetical protein